MTRREGVLVLILLSVIGLFFYARGCDRKVDRTTSSASLDPNVVEKLVVNPSSHQLTIVTPNHEQTLFLPDRPSSIEITKNNQVSVTFRQYGTEIKPFFGIQMSNAFRVGIGLDLLYYKKLDLGIGVAGQVGMHTPVVLTKLSYTVWDNSSLGLTFDTAQHVGVMLSVRL